MPTLTDRDKDSFTVAKLKQVDITSPTTNNYNTDEIELKQLSLIRIKLEKLKNEFEKSIDIFAENTSLFSRAAIFWGKLSWWQKLLIGPILLIPMFMTALLTHLIPLLVISLCTIFMFTISSFFLDNHYKHCAKDKEKLKQGFLSFTTVISEVIISLNKLRNQLSIEIEKLHGALQILSDQLLNLHKKLTDLEAQIGTISELNDQLHTTKNHLESIVAELSVKIRVQEDLLEQANLALKQIMIQTELKEAELSSSITVLNQTNEALEVELKKTKQILDILKSSTRALSGTLIEDKEHRIYFQHRLNEFLANEELTLDHFALSLLETESKLHKAGRDFTCLNEDYAALLALQEIQIERLEVVSKRASSINTLNDIGFFSLPKLNDTDAADSLPSPFPT